MSVSPLCINEFIIFQNIKAPHHKVLSPLTDKDEAIDKEDAYAYFAIWSPTRLNLRFKRLLFQAWVLR